MKYLEMGILKDIAIITISREKSMNALNYELLIELNELIQRQKRSNLKCVIITGAGKRSFVAGADVSAIKDLNDKNAREFASVGNRLLLNIERLEIPVIAAINGYALGGGLELALACDIRIASENAIFGLPELSLGIIPGFGGTQRLMRMIPSGLAKEIIFAGLRLDAKRAEHIGLINNIYQQDELLSAAINIAGRIASNSIFAVKAAKKVMNKGINLPLSEGLIEETISFGKCFSNKDQKIRMNNFLNKAG